MTVCWGFLGAGYVASRAMAPAVHTAQGATLQSVASRDVARSSALEPQTVAANYHALLDDPEVDAVYVSLTNTQHREWVIAALRAGKHVLCEKPLGVTVDDVTAMRAEADHQQRLIVEATWIRWHPRFRRLVELATSGALGEIQSIESAFTFENSDPDNYRWQPKWGGGALLDVGCYQAHLWAAIAGADATLTVTSVERDMSASGVDATTVASTILDGNIAAHMECSFIRSPQQRIVVTGSEHRVRMAAGEAFTSWREPSSLEIDDVTETFPDIDAFVVMVEEVSARIETGEGWIMPFEQSMKAAQIVDAIAAT